MSSTPVPAPRPVGMEPARQFPKLRNEMTDLDARADRVRAVVEPNFGKVMGREGSASRHRTRT